MSGRTHGSPRRGMRSPPPARDDPREATPPGDAARTRRPGDQPATCGRHTEYRTPSASRTDRPPPHIRIIRGRVEGPVHQRLFAAPGANLPTSTETRRRTIQNENMPYTKKWMPVRQNETGRREVPVQHRGTTRSPPSARRRAKRHTAPLSQQQPGRLVEPPGRKPAHQAGETPTHTPLRGPSGSYPGRIDTEMKRNGHGPHRSLPDTRSRPVGPDRPIACGRPRTPDRPCPTQGDRMARGHPIALATPVIPVTGEGAGGQEPTPSR